MVNMQAILVGLLSVAHTPEQADHAARSVLEQHAHELAELLRQDTTATGEANDQYALLYADLIERTVRDASNGGDTP
jgi:hypothetical protein